MEILKVNLKDSSAWGAVHKRMIEVFNVKGTVVFPTDTVYGLGCNAFDETAVSKVFLVKKRDASKPLPIFVRDIAQAKNCVFMNRTQECFLKKVWPGPVTAVFKKTSRISERASGGGETVGVRVPAFSFLGALMDKINFPIIGTSANISGEEPVLDSKKVLSVFQNESFQPDLVIDGGVLPVSKPSTVVDLTSLKVVRKGVMSEEKVTTLWEACIHGR